MIFKGTQDRGARFALAISSGILLGCSFPPIPTGITAFVGFVPLLFLIDRLKTKAQVFRWSYITFLVFNLITVYWISGWWGTDPWLKAAGVAVNLVHPLLFTFPVLIYFVVRKRLGGSISAFFFPVIWTTYEWLAHLPELSFPWLIIGNSQAIDIEKIQFISFTGIFGASFWITTINTGIFVLLAGILSGALHARSRSVVLGTISLLAVYIVPVMYGFIETRNPRSFHQLTVGIAQPNIDPYEKWSLGQSPNEKLDNLLSLYDSAAASVHCDLVLLPETAIPFLLLEPAYRDEWRMLTSHVDSVGVPLLTGFADIKWYDRLNAPASARRIDNSDVAYLTFNSSILVTPSNPTSQVYHKSRLTPISERIPYLDAFPFLQDLLTWGVGISNWGLGNDTTVFHWPEGRNERSTWAMICYETLYPSFVAGFARRGASFFCVITNDGWFGNSSGPYQLERYAALRAVENRRGIARCANNGVSCFIDPYGRVHSETIFGTRTSITGSVALNRECTFYTLHGDWLPEGCALLSILVFLWTMLRTGKEKS